MLFHTDAVKRGSVPYRRYFAKDGDNNLCTGRCPVDTWRIAMEKDKYQSTWPRDAIWEGWYVMEYAGDFH